MMLHHWRKDRISVRRFFQDNKYDQDIIYRCKYLIDKRNCYVISAKTPVFTYEDFNEEDDKDNDNYIDKEEKLMIKMFVDSKGLPVDDNGKVWLFKELKNTDIYFTSYNFESKQSVSNFPKDTLFIPTTRVRKVKTRQKVFGILLKLFTMKSQRVFSILSTTR